MKSLADISVVLYRKLNLKAVAIKTYIFGK